MNGVKAPYTTRDISKTVRIIKALKNKIAEEIERKVLLKIIVKRGIIKTRRPDTIVTILPNTTSRKPSFIEISFHFLL